MGTMVVRAVRSEKLRLESQAQMGQTIQLSNGLPSCIRPGEVLGGKYRLERELGRGAMGTVWSAMHLTLGQRVAIKLISAEHAQSPEARARFSIEAKAAARLKSRHVVQVYDDGETPEGTPYIVMEYLEGESLESRLDREGSIPLIDAVRITGQVARALARAHAQGIVHRDLKPGNIFLARSDEDELGWLAKVLDFGIAKVEEHREQSTTKTGTVLGTPLFMSPEQVRGASTVDNRADLYSLGMCFYNMLTGRFGFDGESFGDILVSICTEPLPDLKALAPWIPEGVALWFQRCCARDPAHRYQSADELVDALQAAVGSTVQLVNRRSAPDEQLGPSGTLKGHSPPLSPNTRAIAEDSGAFTVRYQPGTLPDDASREQPGVSSESTSVLTVHERIPTRARSAKKAALLLSAIIVCVALGGAALFVGGSQQPESADPLPTEPSLKARAGVPASATVPTISPPPADPKQGPPAVAEEPGAQEPASSAEAPAPSAVASAPVRPASAPAPRPRPKTTWRPSRQPAENAPKLNTAKSPKPKATPDLGF